MFSFLKKHLNQSQKETYVGLCLRDGAGSIFLISTNKEDKTTNIIDEKQFTFTNSWENLIEDVDETLYQLEQKNNVHADNIILFLYSHLVDQQTNHIKKPYLAKIKELAKEMELSILGYVEYHEAIALYSNHIEGTTLTAVLVEVDKSVVSLFIYKGGKRVNAISASKTEDLTKDLESMFSTLKGDFLPTKIILYDALDVDSELETVLTHKWEDDLFIQIPHVEIVSQERLRQALVYAFGLQIFGEMTERNIGTMPIIEKHEVIESHEKKPLEGFVVGADVAEEQKEILQEERAEVHSEEPMAAAEHFDRPLEASRKSPFLPITSFFSIMLTRTRSVFSQGSNRTPLILIIIALALIFGSLFSIEYFFHKASLSLFFKSPQIDKELTLDDNFTLKKVEESVSESQSAKTTGKKTIGTKAKGEATIFNLEKSERNLKQGTILVSDKGVKFTLDSDVKIASASSSTTSGGDVTIVTGKQKALLTAAELGKAGNIEKSTTLRMEGVSTDSMRATAEKTFTGGTEEDVQTVAKSDMDKLTKAVQDKIKKRGDEIVGKKLAGSKVVDDLTEITVIKTDFSKELSEETNEVTLKITAKVTFFTYQDADIRKTINEALSEAIPENFKLEEGDISYEILKADDEDDKVSLTLKVKAKPQKEIDIKSVQKAVSGKKTSELEEFLKGNYDIDGYNVQINTTLPLFKSRLPFVSGNIKVQTKVL